MSTKSAKAAAAFKPAKEKGTTVELEIDASRFHRKMPFTAYRLSKQDSGILMEFYYHENTRGILDSYACFIGNHDAVLAVSSLTEYATKLPDAPVTATGFDPENYRPKSVEVCSMFQMARTGEQAEILLVNFSLHAAINSTKSESKVGAEVSCRLLSGYLVHRAFVLEFIDLVKG